MFVIGLEGVPIFFFKGKQIKKFKLLYIIFFFSSQGVPGNTLDSEWRRHWICSKALYIIHWEHMVMEATTPVT